MFKILFILLGLYAALCLARPSYVHSPALLPSIETISYEPTIVGHSYTSYPTAVSHQSSTIVHEKRPYLPSIVQPVPLFKSYGHGLGYAPTLSYEPLAYDGLYDHAWNGIGHYPSIYWK